jgi:hypothetical protein
MAKVKIQGNASGTGVITLIAPNTNTDRTVTLPDESITLSAGVTTLAALTDSTVSSSDPTRSTNPSAVGHLWINSTSGEQFIATTITAGDNVWKNQTGGSDVFPYDFDPTSPYDYGDGTDGDVTSITVTDTYLTNSPSASSNTCTVNSTTGFASGDQVLLHQTQKNGGLSSGTYEMIAISGIAGSTITFNTNLQNGYSSGTFDSSSGIVTQMVKVPNYNNVTLTGQFNVPAWNGYEGGIVAFKVRDTLTLTAKINAVGKGFRGGVSTSVGYGNPSQQGEGQVGKGSNSGSANGNGGGGGRMNVPGTLSSKTGAGGGHAAAGGNGNSNAVGGTTFGGQALTSHLGFGGGGGAGGYDYSDQGGDGGSGGGIILICGETITLSSSGELAASGGGGVGNVQDNYGGSGGGSIYIKSDSCTTNNAINAIASNGAGNGGGNGGAGRIHIQGTSTGTTNPTAYTV